MGKIATHWRATNERSALGDRVVPVVGLPVEQMLLRSPRIDHYFDEDKPALASRIRSIVQESDADVDRLVPMARIFRAKDNGPLRTFSGALAHECGWLTILKAARLLHWQGVAQRALLIRSEVDSDVQWVASESVALQFPLGDKLRTLTIDVETRAIDGTITVYEVKRDANDLSDASYRDSLAISAEIFRRCGIRFLVIFRDEIFKNRVHRKNAELFAARAFTSIDKRHVDRLEELAIRVGAQSTYGELAEALEPTAPNFGRALIQALTVRRRVQIDLTGRLYDHTPLTIN